MTFTLCRTPGFTLQTKKPSQAGLFRYANKGCLVSAVERAQYLQQAQEQVIDGYI